MKHEMSVGMLGFEAWTPLLQTGRSFASLRMTK